LLVSKRSRGVVSMCSSSTCGTTITMETTAGLA
jgi:hypothetical protein